MKRWLAGLLLLVLGCVMLTACGGSDSQSTSASSSTGSTSQSSGAQNSSSSSTSSGAQTVHITEGEMYIKSDVVEFKVGTPYHFIVKNEGKMPHEFTIAKKVPGGNQDSRDAASVKDVDNINGGQTATVDYTFTKAAPAEGMEFECSYPNHYEMGMHMDITVK